MRVCFVSLFPSDDDDDGAAAPLLRRLPAAMADRGHEVSVVRLSNSDSFIRIERAAHHFVRPRRAVHWAAALAGAASRRPPALFEWPRNLSGLLRSLRPDVVHVHGTQLHIGLARLRRALPPGAGLVVQYHGGEPSRRVGVRAVQRSNLRRADAVLFTTSEQVDAFGAQGMLSGLGRAALVTETSSDFKWIDRTDARATTGMVGRPVYLSAARLHPIKDPMTMLAGFERIVAERPESRLYLYYLSDELLPDMRAFVGRSPELSGSVQFRGRASRRDMEAVFNSADFLLQASLREFSGCALLDALACGVVPVISDLPSFRVIADRHGVYFPPGDGANLANAALAVDLQDARGRSAAIRDYFERELGFGAMARKLEAVYTGLQRGSS